MRRGQSALEFVLITAGMLMLFTITFMVMQQKVLDVQEERLDLLASELSSNLQSEIRVAYESGAGYERKLYIPRTLSGIPYEIQLNTNQTDDSLDELVLYANNKEYLTFLTYPVDGTLERGYINITGGRPVQLTLS